MAIISFLGANAFRVSQPGVYSFLQVPAFSRLSGYQLLPRWTASVGVSAGF